MLKITNLSKSFGENKLFSDLSFTAENNSLTTVTGKSGCGKTTLFNIIMGLDKPDGGAVETYGGKIRTVFQDDRLLENRTPVENLEFVGIDRDYAKKILCSFGLSESLNEPAKKLSGGMKRRVALARAIGANPDILLLDEPFNAIDAATKGILIEHTLKFAENHTVIMISHNADEIKIANKIIEL